MIFAKMLNVDVNTLDDSAAVTLMSTDVDKITTSLEDFHEIWASPIEVGIASYILQRQTGTVAAAPIVVALCKSASNCLGQSHLVIFGNKRAHLQWSNYHDILVLVRNGGTKPFRTELR